MSTKDCSLLYRKIVAEYEKTVAQVIGKYCHLVVVCSTLCVYSGAKSEAESNFMMLMD